MTATAPNYNRTVVACFNVYVTQAVINNFIPLLFVTFSPPSASTWRDCPH